MSLDDVNERFLGQHTNWSGVQAGGDPERFIINDMTFWFDQETDNVCLTIDKGPKGGKRGVMEIEIPYSHFRKFAKAVAEIKGETG